MKRAVLSGIWVLAIMIVVAAGHSVPRHHTDGYQKTSVMLSGKDDIQTISDARIIHNDDGELASASCLRIADHRDNSTTSKNAAADPFVLTEFFRQHRFLSEMIRCGISMHDRHTPSRLHLYSRLNI